VFAEGSDFPGAQILDMLVVGGGINGVGIARDAAGRGLSVRLVEKGDLAAATSSASSSLSDWSLADRGMERRFALREPATGR
jgi:glycine/D-amino acid oxidase-like deaminating enzyme